MRKAIVLFIAAVSLFAPLQPVFPRAEAQPETDEPPSIALVVDSALNPASSHLQDIVVAPPTPTPETPKRVKARPKKQAWVPGFGDDIKELLTQAGIAESDWGYVDFVINHEAGWNGTTTYNRAGSGAYGICQSLPGNKMAAAGADWRTNRLTQLKWCNGNAYSKKFDAYGGGWKGVYYYWLEHHAW